MGRGAEKKGRKRWLSAPSFFLPSNAFLITHPHHLGTPHARTRTHTHAHPHPHTHARAHCPLSPPPPPSPIQASALDTVASLLGVSHPAARTLLIHFRWSLDALCGILAERGEAALFRLAGVAVRTEDGGGGSGGAPATTSASRPPGREFECGVCMTAVPTAAATAMPCGHTFCDDCWRGHLVARISGGGRGARVPCAGVKCGALCDEAAVRALLSAGVAEEGGDGAAAAALATFERALAQSYVDDNARVRWCPSVPHCGAAVEAASADDAACEPVCACGTAFCFGCGADPHSPATCSMAEAWARKCRDDSETATWMTANTKPCPKCSKPVEKVRKKNKMREGCPLGGLLASLARSLTHTPLSLNLSERRLQPGRLHVRPALLLAVRRADGARPHLDVHSKPLVRAV